MWWPIILLGLLCLGLIPLGVIVTVNQSDVDLRLRIGCFRFAIANDKKEKKSKEKPKKESFESRAEATGKRQKNSYKKYLSLVKPVFRFLADFKRKLRVNDLQLKVILGGDDPCDLSVNYGRAWIAVGNLMPLLERFFVIKKRNVEVACDYTADATVYHGKIDVSSTLGRLLQVLIYHGVLIVREYFKIMKQAKDGATL